MIDKARSSITQGFQKNISVYYVGAILGGKIIKTSSMDQGNSFCMADNLDYCVLKRERIPLSTSYLLNMNSRGVQYQPIKDLRIPLRDPIQISFQTPF